MKALYNVKPVKIFWAHWGTWREKYTRLKNIKNVTRYRDSRLAKSLGTR